MAIDGPEAIDAAPPGVPIALAQWGGLVRAAAPAEDGSQATLLFREE